MICVYGSYPKCKRNSDEDYPCLLDDLSQLQCDPEWVMTYGSQLKKTSKFKNFWYTCWKTGKYIEHPLKQDLSWMDELNNNYDDDDNDSNISFISD